MHVFTDIKHAARTLRHESSLSAVVVLTLALGIGATTAIVSVVDDVLLNPLPYTDAERLVLLWQRNPEGDLEDEWLSPAQFRDIRDEAESFDDMALLIGGPGLLNLDGPAEVSGYIQATSSFLRMLGAKPFLGRILTEEDDQPDAAPVVVITHSLWQRRFGSDTDIIGKKIGIERFEVPVVGVLEPGFLLSNEVFPTPENIGKIESINSMRLTEERLSRRDIQQYNVLARLAPGVTIDEAQTELDLIASRMAQSSASSPTGAANRIDVVPLLDQVVGDVRARLWMLLAAAALMLVVACMNAANLLLARAASRRRELAIYAAIGANRRRLVTKLLSESLLLGLTAGAVGLGFAWVGLTLLRYVAPANLPRLNEVGLDGGILIFAVGLSLVTVSVSGWLPAWCAARIDVVAVIKGTGSRVGVLPKKLGLAGTFVVVQISAAFVLLMAAVLLLRSFDALLRVDPGFEPRGRLTMRIQESPRETRSPEEVNALFTTLLERIRSLPGVRAAATGTPLPFSPGTAWSPINAQGYVREPGEPAIVADWLGVSPHYFETMEVELLAGRAFDTRDYTLEAPPVRIVDRRLAERFWPGKEAIGQQIWRQTDSRNDERFATIVGIVAPVRRDTLESESHMAVYLPRLSRYRTYLVVSTNGDPRSLANPIADTLRSVEPDIAISDLRTMEERITDALAAQRLSMLLVQSFAIIALVVTTVGLYGVIGHGVAKGTPEIGVRMALGASPSKMVRFVTRHGIRIAFLGISIGGASSLFITRLMRHLLFEVSPVDPASYALATLVLGSVSLLACWLPSRCAADVDPVVALHAE